MTFMAARTFFIPGVIVLFCALILSILVSVSLPSLPVVDIARAHFTGGIAPHVSTGTESIGKSECGLLSFASSVVHIVFFFLVSGQFGIWAYCIYDAQTGHRTCINPGYGYKVQLLSASNSVTIGPGATRGLAVHPVATGVTFIALLFSFSSHFTTTLIASLLSFIAALLTLIAFVIDIALYTIVHNSVSNLDGVQVRSVAAPGFWITLVR
ncbi:hypothetical protein BJV78DRAFT_553324 [Lactifluus subvellereus]|nr:hypothetical protein BJV78DRAFT_553324 [Lactifluus subvellereus]